MSFEVKLTDKFFYDSPDAGHPACLCSRCGKQIREADSPVIRAWPTMPTDYGYDPAAPGNTEFRYCRQCCEGMGMQFCEVPDDPDLYFDGPDYDDDDPVGHQCLGCGHVQDHPGECDMCTGYSVEPYF